MPRPEEFPDFRHYWLERPSANSKTLTVHALLDSPSVAGAYSFLITPGDVTLMEVDATLYPRKNIERVGIAPLTSMFQCGENDRRVADDWRPEIHDSDGLAMWSGILHPAARPVVGGDTWRCNFDLSVTGTAPVDLRLFLKDKKGALTETWIYQYTP